MVETQRAEQQRSERPSELLAEIRRRVRLPSNVIADDALEAVLCTISQHGSGGDARHVVDAMPKDLRPRLARCSSHENKAVSRFDRNELLRRIGEHLQVSPGDAEDIASAVLMAIGSHLDPKDVHRIADQLPLELRELWAVRRAAPPVEPHPILAEIERSVALPYGVTGVGAFSLTMGTFTRRLPRSEARPLVGHLAVDLRPLLESFLVDRDDEPEELDKVAFLARITALTGIEDPEPVVRAVFRATEEYLRTDVFEHVMCLLPADLQELWELPTLA